MTFKEWWAKWADGHPSLDDQEAMDAEEAAAAWAWSDALEVAAKLCETQYAGHFDRGIGPAELAAAIRALKSDLTE